MQQSSIKYCTNPKVEILSGLDYFTGIVSFIVRIILHYFPL